MNRSADHRAGRLQPSAAILLFGAAVAATLTVAVHVRRQRRCIRALLADAQLDPLTGLPNRRQLAAGWARLPEAAILFIDLIGFRSINDRHGHLIGDQLLQQVARRLASVIPPPETLVRWGGDEFIAIVRRQQASQRRQALTNALATPFDLGTDPGPLSVRISARSSQSSNEIGLADALSAAAAALLTARADAAPADALQSGAA